VMNTGRQMYHWHTGTMSRRSTGLDSREPTPVVEINPLDAIEMGLADGDPVRVTSRRGSMLIGARVSERQARGQIFIPFHFREAAANLLTNPRLDPYAKIAEFKISAVRVDPVREGGKDGKEKTSKAGKGGRAGVKEMIPRHGG
jgi:formate dehydrogenase major subunit